MAKSNGGVDKMKGDNCYKLPHMGKDKCTKNGTLDHKLACDPEAYVDAVNALNNRHEAQRLNEDLGDMFNMPVDLDIDDVFEV